MKETRPENIKNTRDPEERVTMNRISRMEKDELAKCQADPTDPAYFFAPNAFINVIDIMREQVISQIRISPPVFDRMMPPNIKCPLSTYFSTNSTSYCED